MAEAECETGKIRYGSQREANKALTKLLRFRAVQGRTERLEQRSYHCRPCDGWHLTSMPWGGR